MNKKKIVFLLVNGIGFGHFKRSIVIADSFDKDLFDISFVVQASSTAIFTDRGYKVYTFPLLYSIKDNNARLIIYRTLNSLLEEIRPCMVFEDTHPEDDYLNLPALRNVPRSFIYRRTEGQYLEQLYTQGYLENYDFIFTMESKETIINKLVLPEVKSFIRFASKVISCGDIFDQPNENTKLQIIEKYNLKGYKKNIVFNCGAGGWHIGVNVCKEIFTMGMSIAQQLTAFTNDYQFIFITGPYSSGSVLNSNLNKNIRIVEKKKNLAALFACADICVIRPGYNAVMECLNGDADVVLIPGISYMEAQDLWCKELKHKYGVCIIPSNELMLLQDCITDLLLHSKRINKSIGSNEYLISETIKNYFEFKDILYKRCVLSISDKCEFQHPFIKFAKEGDKVTFQDSTLCIANKSEKPFNPIEHLTSAVVLYDDERLEFQQSAELVNSFNFDAYGIIPIVIKELVYYELDDAKIKLQRLLRCKNVYAINIEMASQHDGKLSEFFAFINKLISNKVIIPINYGDIVDMKLAVWSEKGFSFSTMELFRLE